MLISWWQEDSFLAYTGKLIICDNNWTPLPVTDMEESKWNNKMLPPYHVVFWKPYILYLRQ
jgi:hypothetical protein